MKCDTCYQTRWRIARLKWTSEGVRLEFRPFSRDGWGGDQVTLATAAATKVLVPCKSCNPKKLPPWAKEWADGSASPETGGDFLPV